MPKLLLMIAGFLVLFVLVVGGGGAWLVQRLAADYGAVRSAVHADLYKQPAKAVKTLVLRANRADVNVHKDPGFDVVVTIRRTGQATSDAEAGRRADEIRWRPTLVGGTLTIEGTVPEGPGFSGEPGTALRGGAHQLVYEVNLPAGPGLDVVVDAGNLSIVGPEGPTQLQVGTGDIDVTGVVGDLGAQTGTGSITVQRGRGATAARATTGDVRVADRPGPRLEMATGTGDLDWSFTADAPAENRLTTDTGDIHVLASRKLGLAIELETETGALTNHGKLPGSVHARERGPGARASLKAGEGPKKLGGRTRTGTILVEAAEP